MSFAIRLLTLFLTALFVIKLPVNTQGQSILNETRNNIVLKFAPLSLFDYYNTVQLGVEIPFPDPRFTFQQELGYGHSKFSIWHAEDQDIPNRHNFRSRSQLRYYLKEWSSFRIFIAGEYFLRRSRTFNTNYIGVGCDGFGCDYYKETDYTTERIVNAVHGKFGFQTWLSRRVSLEVYTGLGLRSVRSRSLNPDIIPTWRDNGPWWEDSYTSRHEPIPSLATGLQLGIRLGK